MTLIDKARALVDYFDLQTSEYVKDSVAKAIVKLLEEESKVLKTHNSSYVVTKNKDD